MSIELQPDDACIKLHTTGGFLLYREGRAGTVELFELFVEPDYRRQGVATGLVQTLELLPFRTIYGFTRFSNETARVFYQHCGFTEILLTAFYIDEDAIMFVKHKELPCPDLLTAVTSALSGVPGF